jgi:hypothetical protein
MRLLSLSQQHLLDILGHALLGLTISTVLAGPKDLDEEDIMQGWLCKQGSGTTHSAHGKAFNRKI